MRSPESNHDPALSAVRGQSSPKGTRATQVRMPPELAQWLGAEARSSGRTLASVVALAARAHAEALGLPASPPPEQLDVSRPVAAGTVPVTLRLNGVQRQLLDDLAVSHGVTRSAIVNAALRSAADGPPGPQWAPAAGTP